MLSPNEVAQCPCEEYVRLRDVSGVRVIEQDGRKVVVVGEDGYIGKCPDCYEDILEEHVT